MKFDSAPVKKNVEKDTSGIGSEAEALLIERARSGDEEAFSSLANAYRRLVYWHIRQNGFRTGGSDSASEAEDLFQEGLIGLLKAIRTYDGVSSAFSTYASACISNSIVSAVRRYRKQNAASIPLEELDLVSGHSPESDFLDRESGSLLYERILSQLSAYEKTVFELFLSDRSYAEIAYAVGKSEKSIANAICRIRRKLRHLISDPI